MRGEPTTAPRRRAHRTLVLAATSLTLLALAGLARPGSAAGQEPPPSTEPPPSSSTTSTEPPPTTVVLDDGDIGVVPPGADSGEDESEPPPPAEHPDAAGPDGEGPPPGEVPQPILPDPTPGLNAALAAIDVTAAHREAERTRHVLLVATDRFRDAARRRSALVRVRRDANRLAVSEQALVRALAQNAVMYGNVAGLEPVLGSPSLAHLRDAVLGDVVGDHLQTRFTRARAALRAATTAEARSTRALQRARKGRRSAAEAHRGARDALGSAIEAARNARRQLGPTILGPTVLEAEDLVAWYRTHYRADPPVAPVTTLITTYLDVAEQEGVTGDIAFAQAILETGGFRSQHARGFNFAGIGAFDRCAPGCGFRFDSLEEGVRAHLQLLRAYADPGLTSAQLATAPDRRVRPEDVDVRGCCPRWTALTGVWASDPSYDRKVLGIYRLMVETARARDQRRV